MTGNLIPKAVFIIALSFWREPRTPRKTQIPFVTCLSSARFLGYVLTGPALVFHIALELSVPGFQSFIQEGKVSCVVQQSPVCLYGEVLPVGQCCREPHYVFQVFFTL